MPVIDQGNTDLPAGSAVVITPSDSADLLPRPRALYVGGAGNITVVMKNTNGVDDDVLFSAIPAGTVLPIRPARIKSTGTTATLIVGMW